MVSSLTILFSGYCCLLFVIGQSISCSNGYLGAEFQETMETAFNRMHPNEPLSPAGGHRLPGFVDYQGMGLKSQFPVERKWALGLQSRAHPREIMTEVLKALQELNVGWKKIGQYNMKCRWIPGTAGHHEGMLYKTRDEKYLLDLQRVQGPQFLFLDLCAAFLAQLRVLQNEFI
uniref:non-specific serine/threonine protein kinase n=1 Tax=Salix viminalis TaxID=40686 RepID=A0A6N2NED9_SALVM